MFKYKMKPAKLLIMLCTPVLLASSCKKKDDIGSENNTYVNDWIYESMNHWYYWNTSMPASPNRSTGTESFFNSLLRKPDDRFSWIQRDYRELLNELSGVSKEAGYDFSLFLYGDNKLGGQVLYVKKGSPAEAAGLKRGDNFFKVNGAAVTYTSQASANNLVDQLYKDHTLSIGTYNAATRDFDLKKTIPLTVKEFAEHPVYLDTVYNIGGKRTGYFVYNFFSPGPTETSTVYDDAVDAAFARFKAAGITNLVLDFRYNPGGNEISTINLASLIVKGATTNDEFFHREYNANVLEEIRKDGEEALLSRKFIQKNAGIGANLEKLVIITSGHTASASELIINGLRPYMNVTLIGDTTYGKNVGSTTLYREGDRRNTWGLQPIITKAFNKNNQSDYTNGFAPDVVLQEGVDLKPLGDINDPLLAAALGKITNGRVAAPKSTKATFESTPVASSLDRKAFSFQLIEPRATLPSVFKR
ncbi:S41 family peptidase [Chitinophaga horti]|uniref:S41 family peptidase n=1 Tax=Chitinophaga horti TaxID=2920382 RepID=A0ABY6IZH6_9BACT|nr:S41 family peptidase [Chitinophaga horti]UYQ92813.1 S41 family peptidase [Chitinophaga horti]